MIKIPVQYSCVLCGLMDVVVRVPARPNGMDIKSWMDETILAVSNDHRVRSPECRPKQLTNLKIPVENVQWVGGPPIS